MTSPDSTQRNPQRHNSEGSFPERYATTIKLVIIGILTLVLLIPLVMIQSLINERQTTRQNAIEEITSKWGGKQTINRAVFRHSLYENADKEWFANRCRAEFGAASRNARRFGQRCCGKPQTRHL